MAHGPAYWVQPNDQGFHSETVLTRGSLEGSAVVDGRPFCMSRIPACLAGGPALGKGPAGRAARCRLWEAVRVDASWAGRRLYGSEPHEPEPALKPGHSYAELVGGPLDGLLLDVTGWPPQEVVDSALLMSQHG